MEPLFQASEVGNVAEVKRLLAEGANVNARSKDTKDTPLHVASTKEVAVLLLACGANVNTANNYDNTPLHIASFYGHKDVIRVLLAGGADINARDNDGKTPLHVASFYDHKEVVLVLLAGGSDINAVDNSGKTPLHVASIEGNNGSICIFMFNLWNHY